MSAEYLNSLSLDELHNLEPFEFRFHDRVLAAIGLPLLIDGDVWEIYRTNYGSVSIQFQDAQRAIPFGDIVRTEGGSEGSLVPRRHFDPSDNLVLLMDRIQSIWTALARPNCRIAETPESVAFLEIATQNLSSVTDINNCLGLAAGFEEIAYAISGAVRIGPRNLPFPTPSLELAELCASGQLEWIGLGWSQKIIDMWTRLGFSVDQARILSSGKTSLVSLSRWLEYFDEQKADNLTFELVKDWFRVDIDPRLFERFRKLGLGPSVAERAQELHFSPEDAGLWLDTNLSLESAAEWRKIGLKPSEAKQWIEAGCSTATSAVEWMSSGLDSGTHARWRSVQATVEVVATCEKYSVLPSRYLLWKSVVDLGVNIERLIDWIASEVSPALALPWIRRGFPADVGAKWVTLDSRTIEAFNAKEFEWARVEPDPIEAFFWKEMGVRLEDVNLAKERGVSAAVFEPWSHFVFTPRQTFAQKVDWLRIDASPQDVAEWLAGGVRTASEARKILNRGFSSKTIERYREEERRIRDAKLREEAASLAKTRAERQAADEVIVSMMNNATDSWLNEILDRANFLRSKIRLVIENEVELRYDSHLSISIQVINNECIGRLGFRGTTTKVIFGLDDFRPRKRSRNSLERLALGLSVSWFIDCTLVLKTDASRTTRLFSSSQVSKTPRKETRVTYVPTPRFHKAEDEVRSGDRLSPVFHSVKGHIRTLSGDMQPSAEARERAPDYIRRYLKANETFVRPHDRGNESAEIDHVLVRLSRHSATANALGELAT